MKLRTYQQRWQLDNIAWIVNQVLKDGINLIHFCWPNQDGPVTGNDWIGTRLFVDLERTMDANGLLKSFSHDDLMRQTIPLGQVQSSGGAW